MRERVRCLGKDKGDLSKYLDAGVERGVLLLICIFLVTVSLPVFMFVFFGGVVPTWWVCPPGLKAAYSPWVQS